MAFLTYEEIGRTLRRLGTHDDDKGLDAVVRALPAEKQNFCVLIAILAQLGRINQELERLREVTGEDARRPQKKVSEVSDAVDQWVRVSRGDVPLTSLDRSKLTTRGRNAVRDCGLVMVSQLSKAKLMSVDGCGENTADEVLKWAGVGS